MTRRSRPFAAGRLLRIGALLVVLLLLLDLAVHLALPRPVNPAIGLRGLFVPDEATGYRLAPGWSGAYDDGVVRGRIRTNRHGDRDDEPDPRGARDLLLIGDSFAFGSLLDQSATIDRWIETLSGGGRDAYNRGVPGFGPPAIREHLRRCRVFSGGEVFYLFYNNDLRSDNLLPDMGLTVFDGFLVPRLDADGRPISGEDLRRRVDELISPSAARFVESWTRLRNLRRLAGLLRFKERIRTFFEPERGLMSHWGPHDFTEANVAAAFDATREMDRICRDRGSRFQVVLVPTCGETRAGRYAPLTESYATMLRHAGIPVHRLLDRLDAGDYHSHNLHFTPSGARKAAEAILDALEEPIAGGGR